MTISALLQRWSARFARVISLTVVLVGCSTVPRQYVKMAEPGVTLTELIAHPDNYRGKVVLLGGTIVDEGATAQYLWLYVKNRPLDQDYVPHRPADMDGPEAGHYWVVMPKQQIPREYRHWARMTVVGQVTGTQSRRPSRCCRSSTCEAGGQARLIIRSGRSLLIPIMCHRFRQASEVSSRGLCHRMTHTAFGSI